jgi:hypothetical protein
VIISGGSRRCCGRDVHRMVHMCLFLEVRSGYSQELQREDTLREKRSRANTKESKRRRS